MKIADKQVELALAEEKYQEIAKKGSSITYQETQEKAKLSNEITKLKKDINDLSTASNLYSQEAQKATNQAALQSDSWKKLETDAKAAGIAIPNNLITGIQQGRYTIPTTIDELNALINFQKAADKAGPKGKEIVSKLSSQIAAGEISVSEATKKLTKATTNRLDAGAQSAKNIGSQTGTNYADGIRGQESNAMSAGKQLGKSGESGVSSVGFRPSGKNAGQGYALGIKDAISAAATSARELARQALKAAKKESKVRSPSVKWRKELGRQEGAGYVLGIKDMIPKAKRAGADLTNAGLFGAASNKKIDASLFNAEKITAVAQAQFTAGLDYKKLAEIMGTNGIYLEGRLVGRAMKEAGVVIG